MIVRRLKKNKERGTTMIEFLLSFITVALLMFWMFEMIMVVYTYSTLTDAAKEGVRYAIVHGSNNPCNVSDVQARVTTFANLSLHDTTSITVDVAYYKPDNTQYTAAGGGPLTSTAGIDPPSRVSVTVSYPFVPYINLPWATPTIYATAQGRIAN